MKTYYFNKKLNIITNHISCNDLRDQYISIYGEDSSIFIDAFKIKSIDAIINFAYTAEQLSEYEERLSAFFKAFNIDMNDTLLVSRRYPKDYLTTLLNLYGIND